VNTCTCCGATEGVWTDTMLCVECELAFDLAYDELIAKFDRLIGPTVVRMGRIREAQGNAIEALCGRFGVSKPDRAWYA